MDDISEFVRSTHVRDVECMLAAVTRLLPTMRERAKSLDADAAFPGDDIGALRECGVLTGPLPRRLGGLGLGTESGAADALFTLLRLLGRGSLAVGRLMEGHVNAVRLVWRYGTSAQLARIAAEIAEGHLFAIWNTEAEPGVRLRPDGSLTGRKINGSAAGAATRAIITVGQAEHSRMLIVSLVPGDRAGPMPGRLQGMRGTQAGWINFDGYRPRAEDWVGLPGDYVAEPEFSAGAWRVLAVLVGGIEALGDMLRRQLRVRHREAAPSQASRIAHALIAERTAHMWTQACGHLAEAHDVAPGDLTAHVNLARRAVEMAGLTVIELTQRSLGLSAFVETNPAEQLMRDLATYLRQPAMDEGLAEAAAQFIERPLPCDSAGR